MPARRVPLSAKMDFAIAIESPPRRIHAPQMLAIHDEKCGVKMSRDPVRIAE
jgi:hypothetical protein